jgi:hypothetical protein
LLEQLEELCDTIRSAIPRAKLIEELNSDETLEESIGADWHRNEVQ